jgi:hypothetical protein
MKKKTTLSKSSIGAGNLNHKFRDPIGSGIGVCNLNGTVDNLLTAGNTNGIKTEAWNCPQNRHQNLIVPANPTCIHKYFITQDT